MVIHNTEHDLNSKKYYTYIIKNNLDHIESKKFHMIKNNQKEIEGQLLSSLHYNVKIPIDKNITFIVTKYNENREELYNYNIELLSSKLKTAYNELKSLKNTNVSVTAISKFEDYCEQRYSVYIDFQVFPSDNDYVCLTLPSFKIYYY